MRRRWTARAGGAVLVVTGLVLAGIGACRPPGISWVETPDIPKVTDLETLMWVQADTADPWFDRALGIPADDLDAAALEGLSTCGERLTLSAGRLVDFAPDPEFASYARQLREYASAMQAAAVAGKAAAAQESLSAIRDTCRGCHSAYR